LGASRSKLPIPPMALSARACGRRAQQMWRSPCRLITGHFRNGTYGVLDSAITRLYFDPCRGSVEFVRDRMRACDRPSRGISIICLLFEYSNPLPSTRRYCSVMMRAIVQDGALWFGVHHASAILPAAWNIPGRPIYLSRPVCWPSLVHMVFHPELSVSTPSSD
jgi:hypothetical protein